MNRPIAGRTLTEWAEFSRRDDCLERMVPSDLRQLIGAIPSEVAETDRNAPENVSLVSGVASDPPPQAVSLSLGRRIQK